MKYSENTIRSMLNSTPRYRGVGFPRKISNGLTVVFYDEAHFLSARHVLETIKSHLVVTLLQTNDSAAALSERLGLKFLLFPYAMGLSHRDVVVCSHLADWPMRNKMTMGLWRRGRNSYDISYLESKRSSPHMFEENKEKIVEIVNKLADVDSVMCYIARVKTLIMADVGFQVISPYWQYGHPAVKPEPEDVICDGGVGPNANTTLVFARDVGPNGRVFAFEPIHEMYKNLIPQTSATHNVELVPMGLWSEPGEVQMYVAGPISTFRTNVEDLNSTGTETCQLTTVDGFFGDRNIAPDLVKLDVEGAEGKALSGAKNVIKEKKPKLQISLYHEMDDIFSIPLQIMEYLPDYKLYIGHHSAFFHETVLYAGVD